MIVFPNCKINLGLNILRKREDGFHDLQTIFYPIPLTDALECIPYTPSGQPIDFSVSGITIAGDASNNICVKAYQLLKADFPSLPPVKMHLHKVIPTGAGLGGGSANGAFTLRLLARQFALPLTEHQLLNYAMQLGSDCAFFIKNQPCFATGRGEILEVLALGLSDYKIILINPGIHVPTGWAFCQLTPREDRVPLTEIITQPVESWKGELTNDFENPIFEKYPEIATIKESMYHGGASYTSMSGSGSTVYGIFPKTVVYQPNLPSHYLYKELM